MIKLGLLISFIIMNNGFDLIPEEILIGFGVSRLWILGFLMMLIFAVPLFLRGCREIRIDSKYLIFFLVFLGVVFTSFIWSVAIYKYDLIDTLKASREYFGYLSFFIFLNLFYNVDRSYQTYFIYIYYIIFLLVVVYIVQYVTGFQIFVGHSTEYEYQGEEIARSIPMFFYIFCMYLWYNLGAWVSGRQLLKGGKLFIILAYAAILFTLTRGIYIASFFSTILVIAYYLKRHEIKISKLIIIFSVVLALSFFFAMDNPFSQRIDDIPANLTEQGSDSTLFFRLAILGERTQIAMEKNPIWGLGFYHPENEADLHLLFGPWEPDRSSPALWSADIAWANIVYQMGLAGVVGLSLFLISFISHFPAIIKKDKFLADDLIGFSVYVELIRQIILMWIGAGFTYNTQNIAFLLALYTYWYQHSTRIRSHTSMSRNDDLKTEHNLPSLVNNSMLRTEHASQS